MRVAIIGCGKVSRGHIRAWQARGDARIVLLVDISPAIAEQRRAEMGLPPDTAIAEDYGEALARPDVDLVDICTPSHCHARQIAEALQAGKHIVTEKPTGYTLEECRFLRYWRWKCPEPKVAVAYSLRYYPVNSEVKRLLAEGALGQVFAAHLEWNHCFDPDDASGDKHGMTGLLHDLGGHYLPGSDAAGPTHVFDLARYFLGEPTEVFSYYQRYGTYAVATFAGGATVTMRAGSTSRHGLRSPIVAILQGTGGDHRHLAVPGRGVHRSHLHAGGRAGVRCQPRDRPRRRPAHREYSGRHPGGCPADMRPRGRHPHL